MEIVLKNSLKGEILGVKNECTFGDFFPGEDYKNILGGNNWQS